MIGAVIAEDSLRCPRRRLPAPARFRFQGRNFLAFSGAGARKEKPTSQQDLRRSAFVGTTPAPCGSAATSCFDRNRLGEKNCGGDGILSRLPGQRPTNSLRWGRIQDGKHQLGERHRSAPCAFERGMCQQPRAIEQGQRSALVVEDQRQLGAACARVSQPSALSRAISRWVVRRRLRLQDAHPQLITMMGLHSVCSSGRGGMYCGRVPTAPPDRRRSGPVTSCLQDAEVPQ